MDNARIHHGPEIDQLAAEYGEPRCCFIMDL